MKRLILLIGLAALGLSQIANAQSMLSPVSHYGSATAGAISGHYKLTLGGGPRTGRYWYWRLYYDQILNSSALSPLSGSTGNQTAVGTFYGPTYSAASSAVNTLSSTATQTMFNVALNVVTILSTPQVSHQYISLSAQTEDIFSFTLNTAADVRLDISMVNGGYLLFTDISFGDATFSAYSTTSFHDTLPAGTYQIAAYLYGNAAQSGVITNAGVIKRALTYKLTVSALNGANGAVGGGD